MIATPWTRHSQWTDLLERSGRWSLLELRGPTPHEQEHGDRDDDEGDDDGDGGHGRLPPAGGGRRL